MRKCSPASSISFVLLAVIFLCGCSNHESISFPEKEATLAQPITMPLQFTEEKPLHFDTARKGGVQPSIKKLDLEMLPSALYDSTGFKPIPAAPDEVHFDLHALPDSTFNPAALSSSSLKFKTYALTPTAPIKVGAAVPQKGNPIAIFDLGPKLGMPAFFVTALLQDRNGLLWIASKEGLLRYDGQYVQTILSYTDGATIVGMVEDNEGRIWFIDQRRMGMIDLANGTVSISTARMAAENALSRMIRDHDGRIWVAKTTAGGPVIINPNDQTFISLGASTGLPQLNGSNDLTQDSTGNIWVATDLQGTAVVNWKTGKIKRVGKLNGLLNDTARAITTDKSGNIWIAMAGGVEAVDINAKSIRHYTMAKHGLKQGFIAYINSDSKGRIWIGNVQGLDVLDPVNGRVRLINKNRGLMASFMTSFLEDNKHRVWVATLAGLQMIDQHAETVQPLGSTQIISLMEDTVGSLWVATNKGIQLIDQQKKRVRYLDKTHGLADDFVQSFARFRQQMWVTSNGGLDIIDPINKTLEHMGKKEGLVNDTVYVIFKDSHGNTWLTGPSNGIDIIDSAKKIILHTDVSGGLADNNLLDIKEDKDGLVWIAGATGGINVIDFAKKTVKYLNNQPGLRDTCSKVIMQAEDGRMWLATDKGIYVADKTRGEITSISTSNGLSHNRVTSLLPYKNSVIVGTNNKVNIITAPIPGNTDSASRRWQVSIADNSEGLLREITNSWSTDAITSKGQYLWGDNGLTVINEITPVADASPTFITGINLMTRPGHFNNHRVAADQDTLWTADSFYVKGQLPAERALAENNHIRWNSVSGAYNMPAGMEIPYNQNYLQFHFVQASLGGQDDTKYTYLLDGIDKNWSAVTTNTSTENYLNLPSGKYSFKVSSKGNSGQWSEPAVFDFTILPPWYKTWWAYTLFAIACAAILRAYIVYRSRMLQKENKVLEEKVQLRTNQLQKSIEDLKATQTQLIQSEKMASLGELTAGIAHEIQNPLNFINNFAEVNTELITELNEELEKGNMEEVKLIARDIAANEEKINHHGKRADSIVKGMLQHSRTGSRNKEAVNINTLADEYLRLAYHGLRAKDKSFNATLKTSFDEQLGYVHIVAQDIGRVVLNLITNAFYAVAEKQRMAADKVSGDKYEPTITVTTKQLGSNAMISVKDNGNGIPQKILDKIFQPFFTTKPSGQGTGLGLSLAYDIVKAHAGELKVETKENEGTEFIILLPIT